MTTHPGEESSVGPFDGRGHAAAWLDRYRTGELAADERARIAGHLEGCAACRDELAGLEAFAATAARGYAAERALRTAAGQAPDWARQQAAIVERTSGSARAARARWSGGLPRYAPQMALALVAVIALGVVMRVGIRGPRDVPVTDAVEEAERVIADRDESSAPPKRDPAVAETATSGTVTGETGTNATARANAPAAPPAPVAEQRRERVAPEDALARDQANEALESRAAEAPVARQAAAALVADPFDRFIFDARRALARRNPPAAARALAFWRDSLAPRADLPEARRRAGTVLADSLAGLVAGRP
ncbi:MAG: zf-HC2 domain-containing protein [Gemmatimonadota bacterium]